MNRVTEVSSREVPPDPSIADAVGRHHTLGTAIADLIDNSIDADAQRVLVRILTRHGRVEALRIIDDGTGMDAATIDRAMGFGVRRAYHDGELGHFGLGLKAASLSQAEVVDVYSRAPGTPAVGRRIAASRATRVIELDAEQVAGRLDEAAAQLPGGSGHHGTVVEWRGLRTFLSSAEGEDRIAWLQETIEAIRAHLGLTLHRLLESARVAVTIDEFDLDFDTPGAPRTVKPIDPFGYRTAGGRVFDLVGQLDGADVRLHAHIWPAGDLGATSYRLPTRPREHGQGFYVYRNDRLLQAGGWNGLVLGGRDLALGRVVFDLDDELARHATINPEKSGVQFDADLRDAVERSEDAIGRTFRGYLSSVEDAGAATRRRRRRPITLVEPRRGLSRDMLDAVADAVEFSEHGSIEIRWRSSVDDALVEVDLPRRTLWINSRYRRVLGADTGEADDAPVVKTLLLLLYSRFFEGAVLGWREKAELQVWNELIHAAIDEELERRETMEGSQDA